MKSLQEFITKHEIDLAEMARIKHRLFVVGRFNRNEVNAENPPKTYLFTNRPKSELKEEYLKLFDKQMAIGFDNFVRALQPAIAEEVKPGRIPAVVQHMPSQEGSDEGSVVIDTWNYFFWRAAANSEQEAFKPQTDGAERELLGTGDGEHGKSIYKQIRRNLNTLCSFQPRTSQLVDAFSAVLGATGMFNQLPAYASGGALPGGFLEKLIDFIYAPDLNLDFTLDGIDISAPIWAQFRDNEKARQNLVKVVNIFRNVLVGAADQHPEIRISGGVTLYQRAKEELNRRPDLVKNFSRARDAYNSLNQIVRSKVLLSMVLEWVFNAHYQTDAVVKLASDPGVRDDDKDQLVAELILGTKVDAGVAPPIKRATTEERDRFRKGLTANFEKLILAVIAEDDRADTAIAALPAEIRGVAKSLRANAERRDMLKRMAMGAAGDPQPFIDSQRAVLVDVLMPVLYQTPTLSLHELRMMFRREVQAAYLTAVTLDDKYQGVVRQIAQDFLPDFLKNIDDRTREIKHAEQMQSDLLSVYIERIAGRDMAERIIEAQEMINRAMTVIENTVVAPGESRGASHVSPFFDEKVGAAKKTKPSRRNIKAVGELAVTTAIEALASSEREKVIETVSAEAEKKATAGLASAASANPGISSGGGAATSGSPAGAAAPVGASAGGASGAADGDGADKASPPPLAADSESEPTDELRHDVKAMVASFLASNKAQSRAEVLRGVREATETDTGIETKTADAVRVFHQILNVIYLRYRENQEKGAFVGRVERMTLANLMLANQESLGLGKACSNLYAMLLDVVENMDPENPDPRAFIRDFSLTRYFDNDVLEKNVDDKSGVTELREVFGWQAHQSLLNTVSFLSELRGIKYLMDLVKSDSRAEVVIINATADEFLEWLDRDNLGQGKYSKHRLQSAFRTDHTRPSASPGLVYLTDSAFGDPGDKFAWLEKLKSQRLQNGNLRLVLPPLCLSTRVQDAGWDRDGQELAAMGSGANAMPAPVVVVGPSPYLNPAGDAFGTYLPAGYLFAAHFLSQPDQRVINHAVVATDQGRFRVIGAGIGQMRKTLDRILWSAGDQDSYAFAADFYLYALLTVLASAENNAGMAGTRPTPESFFPFLTGRGEPGTAGFNFKTSQALDPVLIGEANNFSFESTLRDGEIVAISLKPPGGSEVRLDDLHWFNTALKKAGLPRFATDTAEIG